MVSLSTGTTYADASRNIRTSVGRMLAGADRKLPWSDTGMVHGHLAATWVETYTDVVLAGDEDTAWPEVVLLDATDFWRWNGGGMKVRAFYVLCAYGYDVLPQPAPAAPPPEETDPEPKLAPAWSYEAREAVGLDPFWVHLTDEELALLAWHAHQTGAAVPELAELPDPAWPKPQKPATSRGRLVRAWASKGNSEKDWVEFLASLPGTPRVVVCDGAEAIARAASSVWGTAEGSITSELVRCTWHMKKNLREHIETDLMRADRKPGTPAEKRARAQAHWLHELSGTALDSAGQWHDFREWAYVALGELWFGEQEVRASKTQPVRMVPYDSATLNWLRANEQRVLLHIACRQLRPGPESTGPLEGAIVKLRTALASRVQSIGNRERTQLLLRLLAAGQRGQADHVQWAERVRAYVASVEGTGGVGLATPELVSCRWHLTKNLREALVADIVDLNTSEDRLLSKTTAALAHPLVQDIGKLFTDTKAHREYTDRVITELDYAHLFRAGTDGKFTAARRWLTENQMLVLTQIERRPFRLGPESTGPLENEVKVVREKIAGRAQALRNQPRINLMLRLLVAGRRGQANERLWAEKVRQHLVTLEGVAPRQRQLTEQLGHSSL